MLDREQMLDDPARCYMRAAVDQLLLASQMGPETPPSIEILREPLEEARQ